MHIVSYSQAKEGFFVARSSSAAREPLDPALVRLVLILAVGAIAPALDSTIVNVALPTLVRAFGASVAQLQWAITGYLLALGMAMPVTAWAADRYGAKRLWLISLALFLLGSVLAGTSWSVASLIAFRVLQGIGAGLLQPLLQTLVVRAAGPGRLGRAITVVTYVIVVAPILGPVVGGLIVDHASWRWIFYVNVPICLAALVLAARGLDETAQRRGGPLDVLGLGLLSPALAAILYGLASAGAKGGFGGADTVVPLAVGLLLLAAFGAHELGQREPALDLRLFRERSFAVSSALLFLGGLSIYGGLLLLTLYYQTLRGDSPLLAGLLLAPQGVGSLLTRWTGGLADRIGARPIVLLGLLLAALGTLPFALAGQGTGEVGLSVALLVRGAGLSAATIGIMTAAYHGLRPDQVGHASGATRIVAQVGGSFGAAVLAMVLSRQAALHQALGAAGRAAAFRDAFGWSIAFTLLAFASAFLLPGHEAARRTA